MEAMMDMTQVKITRAGKPVEGDPQPGYYYGLEVPADTDIRAAAKELKKKFPKSYFTFRVVKQRTDDGRQKTEAEKTENTKDAKNAKK
jgi:hypothetical protein